MAYRVTGKADGIAQIITAAFEGMQADFPGVEMSEWGGRNGPGLRALFNSTGPWRVGETEAASAGIPAGEVEDPRTIGKVDLIPSGTQVTIKIKSPKESKPVFGPIEERLWQAIKAAKPGGESRRQ